MSRKPRVLQICHDYKGPFRTIARQYAGCFADCDVTTVFLLGGESSELAESIYGEVIFLNLVSDQVRGLKMDAVKQIRGIVGEEKPDIIIAHRYKPLFISLMLDRELDIPVVMGVMHEYGFLGRLTRAIYSRFWKSNVHLIGVSRPIVDEVRRSRPHLADRIHLVPNAFEADSLVDPVTARHRLGVPLDAYCYGTIGRLVEKKNHALLIRAFARLEGEPMLAIIGEGPMRTKLEALCRECRVTDRVRFCGQQENARTLMKAFDAFVLSSDHREAFGMVLLEAMAASVPVVTTDAPGPASVVGKAALTFESGNVDALVHQLEVIRTMDRKETAVLTKKAIKRLGEEFALSVMARRLRETPPIARAAPVRY